MLRDMSYGDTTRDMCYDGALGFRFFYVRSVSLSHELVLLSASLVEMERGVICTIRTVEGHRYACVSLRG
jgi:hypothetical protein